MIKIIVAGSRDFNDYDFLENELNDILMLYETPIVDEEIEIIEGGAKGVDALAKEYAINNHYKFKEFSANWSCYGTKAGPIRNKEMAEYGDVLIAFYKGKESKGTSNMIQQAMNRKLRIHIIPVSSFE